MMVVEYWLPLMLWVGLTYFFSTDNFSAGATSRFIVPILKFILPSLSGDQLNLGHLVVRKLGHISEYFVLAVLVYRAVNFSQPDFVRVKLNSFGFVLFAAMNDEFHQSFTLYRGASIVDVGYDCLGGFLALWLISRFDR